MAAGPVRRDLEVTADGRSLLAIAQAIAEAGGRGLVVGGWVRDALLGRPSKDLDLEVHGLSEEELERVLERFGRVLHVGRAFAVLRVAGIDLDVSLPRRDSLASGGGGGGAADPELGAERAARRRDLTINAIAWDPLQERLIDPCGGVADLERRRLRAADPERFGDDPLRGLRVAGLHARLEMEPDAELRALVGRQDLSRVAGERLLEELKKLLLRAARPSLGLALLEETGLLRFFPELAALRGVPQDPCWHPEGDVWTHTLLCVDRAAELRRGETPWDLALSFGVLCHDLGKPLTTETVEGRVRSHGHAEAGVEPTKQLLVRLRASTQLVTRVVALVRHHLAPVQLGEAGAGARAYRRLARRLAAGDASMALLESVARADHLGRTTDDARHRRFAAGDEFLEKVDSLGVGEAAVADAVLGRHLLERGLVPGPQFRSILEACRDRQDTTGERDPEVILDAVLGSLSGTDRDG